MGGGKEGAQLLRRQHPAQLGALVPILAQRAHHRVAVKGGRGGEGVTRSCTDQEAEACAGVAHQVHGKQDRNTEASRAAPTWLNRPCPDQALPWLFHSRKGDQPAAQHGLQVLPLGGHVGEALPRQVPATVCHAAPGLQGAPRASEVGAQRAHPPLYRGMAGLRACWAEVAGSHSPRVWLGLALRASRKRE